MLTQNLLLSIALAPLVGAIIAGFFGRLIGRTGSHIATIAGVAISFALSLYVFKLLGDGAPTYNENIYTWFQIGNLNASAGFWVDKLTATMMLVVTSVSLMVHIYTIGYMKDDPGYQRFFAYISLFTFSMLMLVMSNNLLQLFFGWEAVGLVSYLLIGFWFKRPTAVIANMKAFIVNRVGDFGFLLGIGLVLMYTGSMDYATIFALAPERIGTETINVWGNAQWSVATLTCLLLFVGAMGKSAQVPLHIWLPDSMEGPTPISALIHAATMVTAGIFMVSRMHPLFEMSEMALSVILVIGATTALFMGLIGVVQNDIKRVVAYSTLSQLGYMTVALGASAYAAAIFHLMTHAFFKALLFLGAGAVIIAMHHEQDVRKMGGLRKLLPITFATAWVGTLALTGFPGTSGFFSKDAIIEAVHYSQRAGSGYAYFAVMAGVFVTAFYSFRLLYLAFHGQARFGHDSHDDSHAAHGHDDHAPASHAAHHDDHAHDGAHDSHDDDHDHAHHDNSPPKEPGWVVTLPLILLAIPSLIIGYFFATPMLAENFYGLFPESSGMKAVQEHLAHGPMAFALHGFMATPFFLALAGFGLATLLYWKADYKKDRERGFLGPVYRLLDNKYYFDEIFKAVFATGSVKLGKALALVGDRGLIDGLLVNGTAGLIGRLGAGTRQMQSGYLYQYAFTMILGLIVMLGFFVIYR